MRSPRSLVESVAERVAHVAVLVPVAPAQGVLLGPGLAAAAMEVGPRRFAPVTSRIDASTRGTVAG